MRVVGGEISHATLRFGGIGWTKGLDEVFQDNVDFSGDLDDIGATSWQYIGLTSGVQRIYPGYSRSTCYDYDPRIRPWYVAATSGPKDVAFILDTSGVMVGLDF